MDKVFTQQSYIGNRFEFKYILDPIKALRIEEFLHKRGFDVDVNSRDGSYLVNSFYFDTPTMGDYRDKDGSFLIRKKMRARIYTNSWADNPEHIWLEIKKKRNMNIEKVRVKVPSDVWASLRDGLPIQNTKSLFEDKGEQNKFDEFLFYYKRQLYRPSVIVKYERMAYLFNFTHPIRITFDRNIYTCRADDKTGEKKMLSVSNNSVIMELKFNNKLPWWFTDMVEQFDLRRDDFSKYRNSVAMFRGIHRIPISK